MPRTEVISKSTDAYRRLKSFITEGRLNAGERITESRAARLLGMGRGPVRESLLRLEAEGLLYHRGKRRSRVVVYAEEESQEDLLLRYEMREHIESGAARLAAKNMNGWQIDRLRALALKIDELMRAGKDSERYDAARAFHQYLMENCGNPLMYRAWQSYRLAPTWPRAASFEQQIISHIPAEARDKPSIMEVVDAIAAHDQDLAEQLTKTRIRQITDAIRQTSFGQREAPSDSES